jgi:hypothetical protein
LANGTTGLTSNDVFYFGNAVADFNVGNLAGPPVTVRTNATDTSAVRQNQSTGINSALITNIYDINKDGRVNATDTSQVRQNQASSLIRYFTAPAALQLAWADEGSSLVAPTVTSQSSSITGTFIHEEEGIPSQPSLIPLATSSPIITSNGATIESLAGTSQVPSPSTTTEGSSASLAAAVDEFFAELGK